MCNCPHPLFLKPLHRGIMNQMETLTKEDLSNILALLNRLENVKGVEVQTVALLQQKLDKLIKEENHGE